MQAKWDDIVFLDFSAFLPWLARVLLSALCLLAVLAWIILNANSGDGGYHGAGG